MGMIGLKIKDETYEKLKWLKTRFEFVHEKSFSWDEFFEAIAKDSLLIIAQTLQRKKKGAFSIDDILKILSGTVLDSESVMQMYRELSGTYESVETADKKKQNRVVDSV